MTDGTIYIENKQTGFRANPLASEWAKYDADFQSDWTVLAGDDTSQPEAPAPFTEETVQALPPADDGDGDPDEQDA